MVRSNTVIGERIKERREALGMSVDDLAQKLGKNRTTVYRYESNGIEKMPVTILEPLAVALDTTPAYLMGWEPDSENKDKSREVIANKLLQYASKPNANEVLEVFELIDSLSPKNKELVLSLIESMKKDD